MPSCTTWYVVITLKEGNKTREVRSLGTANEAAAKEELETVRNAMKVDDWVDTPWFSARVDVVQSAHLASHSVGSFVARR